MFWTSTEASKLFSAGLRNKACTGRTKTQNMDSRPVGVERKEFLNRRWSKRKRMCQKCQHEQGGRKGVVWIKVEPVHSVLSTLKYIWTLYSCPSKISQLCQLHGAPATTPTNQPISIDEMWIDGNLCLRLGCFLNSLFPLLCGQVFLNYSELYQDGTRTDWTHMSSYGISIWTISDILWFISCVTSVYCTLLNLQHDYKSTIYKYLYIIYFFSEMVLSLVSFLSIVLS